MNGIKPYAVSRLLEIAPVPNRIDLQKARQAGVNRNDLKIAVHRYLAVDAGVTEDAVPETEANDSDDLGKHLAIIDRALAKFRERRE